MMRLRGHHLLCALTFAGRGYTEKFEKEFTAITERLKRNETILVVSGPDDICESIRACRDSHCQEDRITRRDELALEDISAHIGQTIESGSTISPGQLFDEGFRTSFQNRSIRRACFDCQWSKMCDQIASTDFSTSLLLR